MKTIIGGYALCNTQDNFSIKELRTNKIILNENTTTCDTDTFKTIECIQSLVSSVIYHKEVHKMENNK